MVLGFGRRAEARAAKVLRGRGYKILEKNYRCTRGEIDLIAQDGETLVFVEVKARSSAGFGGAAAAVTRTKQARLVAAASHYLAKHSDAVSELGVRFDVVAIDADEVTVIKDAFRPSD